MQGATVATTSSRALLAACAELGLDTAPLLAAAGLTAAQIGDPDGRLDGAAVAILWRGALAASNDPGIGLRAAAAVPFGAYRVIDFLAASSPTVGEALLRVARYFPLINSAVRLVIDDDDVHDVRLVLAGPDDPAGVPRPYAEYALGVTFLHCRHATGVDWPLRAAAFVFPAPPSTDDHARVFGCPVAFGRPRNELVIGRATWSTPSRNASMDLLRTLEDHADRLIASLRADETSSAVMRVLMEELRGGEPSLERVAKRVGMSTRTLQRKLRLEGSSFADVLDRTRRYYADCYVKEPSLAMAEIAHLLGFSEQSAFTRAFQRWYGVSPSRYRADHEDA